MTLDLSQDIGEIPNVLLPYLSAATRQRPKGTPITLTTKNWREFVEAQRAVRIPEKLERVLEHIGREAHLPGGACKFDLERDYPLFSATTSQELRIYLDHLAKVGLLTGRMDVLDKGLYQPTMRGWQRLESIPPVGSEPNRCFVAMWFSDHLDAVYETGFAKAISGCEFKPYRVKGDPTNKAVIAYYTNFFVEKTKPELKIQSNA
jgi:hypothetical protein